MPRRVEDIRKSDRRTIRDVSVDDSPALRARRSSASRDETEVVPIQRIRVTPPVPPRRPKTSSGKSAGRGGRKIWLVIVAAVVLIVAGTAFVASKYFSRATFTVVPVTIPVAVNNSTVVATGTSTPGYLRYEIIKYNGTASTTIAAQDGAYTSTKASGTVILYNYFSDQGQRLLSGTRFSNETGMIYRLTSSVFIPGYKMSGGTVVPGTLRATVVADEAGSQYNLGRNEGSTELRIVAYKGAPRYDKIYARLQTDITGGFAGTKKTVNPSLLASTTKNLESTLTQVLLSQAKAGVPDGYITYDTAYTTSFNPAQVGGSSAGSATVAVTGSLYSIMFKKSDLVAKLAGSQNTDKFGKSEYSSPGLESLAFTITNPGTFRPAKANALIARLSGSVTLKGTVPVSELKKKLAGLSLPDTRAVFASYSSVIDVAKSYGELFPSWASAVPVDEKRININVKDE